MPVDITGLVAAVDHSVGVKASAAELIKSFSAKIAEAVAAALAADDAADQGSIDAANAAIAEVTAKVQASTDQLAAAMVSNPAPGETPPERRR